VLTRDRLDDLVPIEPAAMADRRVIEWEKDDIEELGLMKLDVLGLGMLGCMRRAFDLLDAHKGVRMNLWSDTLQVDDPKVYEMIQKADTVGVFQIESRAQMSMLPRLKPKEFTTSSSRSRSSGRGRSRATWSTLIAPARGQGGSGISKAELRRSSKRRWACRFSRSRR